MLDQSPTPPIPDGATDQFINSLDEQQQQISPTQIFTFSSTWPTSPPLSTRISEEDNSNKTKGIKHQTTTLTKSTLECHQSRKIRNKSDSVDLEMDDPLQSPTLAASIAYLEETDLIPPVSRSTSITESMFYFFLNIYLKNNFLDSTPNLDINQTTDNELEHLHDLLNTATASLSDKNIERSSLLKPTKMTNSNSSAANLTC